MGRATTRAWRRHGVALGLPVALFVCLTSLYLIRTPAWDNNDEADHVRYVEHIVATGRPPSISARNGIESHQPPLYYVAVAAWQRVAGVPPMDPSPIAAGPRHRDTNGWILSHDYDREQRRAAMDLRVLRVPSLVFGASVVVAAFLAAQLTFGRRELSGAVATLVAVWPKFDAVSAAVTNDVLADAVCAWLLVVCLLWRRDRGGDREVLLAVAVGALCAAAALTKYTTLPVVAGLGGYWALTVVLKRRWLPLLAGIAVAAALSGWWFFSEWARYGDPLAAAATAAYLRAAVPHLLWPSPMLDPSVLLGYPIHQFIGSIWWDGDWNQLLLPYKVNLALGGSALLCILVSVVRARGLQRAGGRAAAVPLLPLLVALAAAGASLVLIVVQTTQFEGRYLLVAIVPVAILLIAGLNSLSTRRGGRLLTWAWPAVLFGVNGYVIGHYLIARGGL